jgi:hypothetical protein
MVDFDDPEYWRQRAVELRLRANEIKDSESRRELLAIAAGYDRMSARAETRAAAKKCRPKARRNRA